MKKILKSLLQYLPLSVQVFLSSYYYSAILKKVNENTEIDFPIVKCLIGSGEVVLDVGANVGIHTKFMVDLVGYDGCV